MYHCVHCFCVCGVERLITECIAFLSVWMVIYTATKYFRYCVRCCTEHYGADCIRSNASGTHVDTYLTLFRYCVQRCSEHCDASCVVRHTDNQHSLILCATMHRSLCLYRTMGSGAHIHTPYTLLVYYATNAQSVGPVGSSAGNAASLASAVSAVTTTGTSTR